jgi:prevent-host-death family protein
MLETSIKVQMYKTYILELFMSTISATAGRNEFFELVNRAHYQNERIKIERHGKPVAAIVSYTDLLKLEALEDKVDIAKLKKAMAESTGFVLIDELLSIRSIDA